MAFTSSLLEHNHKGRDVVGESQMMKHKMVVPKVIKCYFSRNFAYILRDAVVSSYLWVPS